MDKKHFAKVTDLDGNVVCIRKEAVVAVGESDSPKYKSWVKFRGDDERLLLSDEHCAVVSKVEG